MKTCVWKSDPSSLPRSSDIRYTAICYDGTTYEVGDCVLIRDEDAPDENQEKPEFCDVARISELYEKDKVKVDKYRAKVQWFSKLEDLPKKFQKIPEELPDFDNSCERLIDEVHKYGNDISVETFFKKCKVVEVDPFLEPKKTAVAFQKKFPDYVFIIRFKFAGKPPAIHPVLGFSRRRLPSIISSEQKDTRKSPYNTKRSPAAVPSSPRILLLSPDDLKPGRRPSLPPINEDAELKLPAKCKQTPKKGEVEAKDFTPVKNMPKGVAKLRVRDGDLLGLLDSDEESDASKPEFYPDGQKKTPLKKATFLTERSSDTKVKFTRIRSSEKLKVVSVEESRTPRKQNTPVKSASEPHPGPQMRTYPAARRVLLLDSVETATIASEQSREAITAETTEKPKVETPRKRNSFQSTEAPPIKKTRPSETRPVDFEELEVVSVAPGFDTPKKPKAKPKTNGVTPKRLDPTPKETNDETSRSNRRARAETPSREVEDEESGSRRRGSQAATPQKEINGGRNSTTPKRTGRGANLVRDDSDEEKTPSFHRRVIGTPRSSGRRVQRPRKYSQSSDEERIVLTPRRRKSKNVTPVTTPRRLQGPANTPHTLLEQARARLHVSAVPDSLPCRETEFADIYAFAEGKIQDGAGGCMYISGVPGTGKTATVHEVVRSLTRARDEGDLDNFKFVEVNGMRVTNPHQVYVQIFEGITGSRLTSAQALQMLNERFAKKNPKKETVLLLVDELDLLWTRKQDVLYNIFDWPSKSESKLVVLAVANTMDLPERIMMNRVSSRLGLVRITFQPYNFKQLQEIVASRMLGLEVFDSMAAQLVARKVAAVSGDARRALDICRRATEIAELQPKEAFPKSPSKSPLKKPALVGLKHVDMAIQEMFTSPRIAAIRSCTEHEKLFLQAVTAEFQRTGIEEAVFHNVLTHHRALCTFHGLKMPVISDLLTITSRLGALRLLITEHARNDLFQRIRLNVSADDIAYALNSEKNA